MLDYAVDHVKALVGAVLVKPHLKICCHALAITTDCVPFDIEDAIGRST
jgi:hypothetical protein